MNVIRWFFVFAVFTVFAEEPPKLNLKEEFVVTNHTINLHGQPFDYQATAGNLILKDEKGDQKASLFFVAYTKEGENRPVTFCFNGGPGSSSIWLHMGLLGPYRVVLPKEEGAPPPYDLVENEYTILDQTDLVFFDPISTGFSKVASGVDEKQFHNVEEDVKAVAEFIRMWVTKYNRWESPKYLAGESYGTTRAAALAYKLHEDYSVYFNGALMISTVLNFQSIFDNGGNDQPYPLILPSYAATALYHGKIQGNLSDVLAQAEDFATNEYAVALMKGTSLPDEEKKAIANKLSSLIGISPEYIERSNLRIPIFRFAKELLRGENRSVGRFDGRIKGIELDPCRSTYETDPTYELIFGPYTASFNAYLRNQLKWKSDDKYVTLGQLNWSWGKACNQYLNVIDELTKVMVRNPSFKVFVAQGLYDLACPYFAVKYDLNHLFLEAPIKNNISWHRYNAGHMMYISEPELVQMYKDMSAFYKK